MSKQSLSKLKSSNQRDNRMKLDKYTSSYGKINNAGATSDLQDKLARVTQNTLRVPVDRSVFSKNAEESNYLKTLKTSLKS